MSAEPPRRAKKISRLGLYAMPAFMLILAVAVAFWWMAATRFAEAVIEQGLADEAAQGRQWMCGERVMGGFPFRIEVECRNLHVVMSGQKPLDIRVPKLRGVAQIYDPRLMIFEVEGPVDITTSPIPISRVAWDTLRASVHVTFERQIDRLSIETHGLSLTGVSSTGATENGSLNLMHGEIHLRINPDHSNQQDNVDFAVSLRDLIAPKYLSAPTQFETQGMIKNGQMLLNFSGPATIDQWRDRGGTIKIDSLSLINDKQNLSLNGKMGLDGQRRPKGEIELSGTGLADFLKLSGNSKLAALQAKDVKLPLLFSSGKLLLGPFALAEMQPLY